MFVYKKVKKSSFMAHLALPSIGARFIRTRSPRRLVPKTNRHSERSRTCVCVCPFRQRMTRGRAGSRMMGLLNHPSRHQREHFNLPFLCCFHDKTLRHYKASWEEEGGRGRGGKNGSKHGMENPGAARGAGEDVCYL